MSGTSTKNKLTSLHKAQLCQSCDQTDSSLNQMKPHNEKLLTSMKLPSLIRISSKRYSIFASEPAGISKYSGQTRP